MAILTRREVEFLRPVAPAETMPRPLRTVMAVAFGLAFGMMAATPAQAGRTLTMSYTLGAVVMQDANLFRLAPDIDTRSAIGSSDRSETVTVTSVGIAAEKELGIQRLKLDMQLSKARYQQFRRLDNDNGNLAASWQWALGQRMHGDLSWSRKTALTGFEDSLLTSRSMNTFTTQSGTANLEVAPGWDLFATLVSNDSRNSAADRQNSNYTSRSTDTGLRHSAAAGHQFMLRQRRLRSALARQDDIDIDAVYAYSPMLRLAAGVGRSRRNALGGTASEISGDTGRLIVNWSPTAKTQFGFGARQEITASASDFAVNTQARSLSLTAGWMPTEKTSLQFAVDQTTRSYADAASTTGAAREDRLRNAGLTMSYRPDRRLSLGLSLRNEARDSKLAAFVYRDRLATVSAQFSF